MEKVGKDITHVLKKEKSKSGGEKKRARGYEEKARKISPWLRWKLIVQMKEGRNVSIRTLSKRKNEVEIEIEE